MVSNMLSRSGRVLCAGVLAVACESVLGIEDLSEGQRPATAGGGGGSGGSGEVAGAGASTLGASGALINGGGGRVGTGGNGGSVVPPGPLDPNEPDGSAPNGPDAGGPFVVTGRVIDFFRRPVPNTNVTIGGTTVLTNAQGEFSISGVEAPYTASLMAIQTRTNGQGRYGYVYEGLTRTDPTLQVYVALPQRAASSISLQFQNTFEAGQSATLAFSSPDGRFVDEDRGNTVQIIGAPNWTGPATMTGNIHALLTSGDPPNAFISYQTFPLAVTAGAAASAGFDLDPVNIAVGSVSGTVTGGLLGSRTNYVALRFNDGTALPLLDETATVEPFSYLVPSPPSASLIVAAADGDSRTPYAVAHRENIALGQTNIALAVPNPVTLGSPQNGGAVTPSTTYSWSALGQTARVFLWHLEFSSTFQGMYVLTSRTEIELPEFADGFTVPPDTAVTWSVETHGDAPNVDAFTGPDGYLDGFALYDTYPTGPNRSDGYYAESQARGFTMGSD